MASSSGHDHLMGASKKRRKELGSLIHEQASAPVSETARNLMAKMGWSENTGLGKRRDGIVSHIRAVKRVEQAGLGVSVLTAEQQQHGGAEWWKDSVGNTLARLGGKAKESSSKKEKKGNKKRKRDAKEAYKIHFTDEELFAATGGKRFGMRAAPTSNLHKWKRTNDDVGATSDKDETTVSTKTTIETQKGEPIDVQTKQYKKEKKSKKEKMAKKDKKKTRH